MYFWLEYILFLHLIWPFEVDRAYNMKYLSVVAVSRVNKELWSSCMFIFVFVLRIVFLWKLKCRNIVLCVLNSGNFLVAIVTDIVFRLTFLNTFMIQRTRLAKKKSTFLFFYTRRIFEALPSISLYIYIRIFQWQHTQDRNANEWQCKAPFPIFNGWKCENNEFFRSQRCFKSASLTKTPKWRV